MKSEKKKTNRGDINYKRGSKWAKLTVEATYSLNAGFLTSNTVCFPYTKKLFPKRKIASVTRSGAEGHFPSEN